MDKTGKIILSYIIAVLVVMAIFVGYKNFNKRPQGGSTAGENYTSDNKSTAGSGEMQEDGRMMANLTLNHLELAFTNPYRVKEYYDGLVKQNIIERYEYNTGEDHIVLIFEKDKIPEFSEYSKKVLDEAISAQYNKYYFEMSQDYSELTLYINPNTDYMASIHSVGRIYLYTQAYVYSTMAEKCKIHLVVKRIKDEGDEIIGEVDIPGGEMTITAENWTGIEDHEEAEAFLNSNLYSYINYVLPEITGDKYYCNAGGFYFDIPKGAEFTTDEVNNQLNELEDSKDLLAVKKKLSGEVAYMESNLVFDDSTFVMLSVNYLEGIEDETGFEDYINNVYSPDLENRDNVTINDVTEIEFLGQGAICVDYVDGDKTCKQICFYRNGLTYYLSGTYKNSESEKTITDFFESIDNM